jgi:hypothetical protein
MWKKYVKPWSLTWWSAIAPIAGGLFIAFAPVHGQGPMADAISNLFGNAPPGVLINSGLALIGVRGAIGDKT